MSKKPGNMANDIVDAIEKATSKWAKTKKSEERSPGRVSFRRVRMTKTRRGMTAKAAAEQVMEEAYMLASAGNTLPATARQIMTLDKVNELVAMQGIDLDPFVEEEFGLLVRRPLSKQALAYRRLIAFAPCGVL